MSVSSIRILKYAHANLKKKILKMHIDKVNYYQYILEINK